MFSIIPLHIEKLYLFKMLYYKINNNHSKKMFIFCQFINKFQQKTISMSYKNASNLFIGLIKRRQFFIFILLLTILELSILSTILGP